MTKYQSKIFKSTKYAYMFHLDCFIHHCMVIRQLHESNIVLVRKSFWMFGTNVAIYPLCATVIDCLFRSVV